MPQTTLAGHPLHPILITIPTGLLPFSLVMDGCYLATGRRDFASSAYYSLVGGTLGGLLAGAAGFGDYVEIPRESRTRRIGRIHGLMNVALLALGGVSIALRRRREARSGWGPAALSAVANVGVMVSSWYGGHLIYELGMRVKGQSEVETRPKLRVLPGDEAIEHGLDRLVG